MKKLSVIIPAYNEEKMIHLTSSTISSILQKANILFEIIFINDGSKDDTWNMIVEESKKFDYIKGINFSRNFGKEAAMLAGLAHVDGDVCVIIDCDLQHPPQVIVDMYRLWEEGYEVVEGVKASRGTESFLHKKAASIFYSIISSSVGIDMSKASDFKLLDRKVIDTLLQFPERQLFFRALSSWVGFKSTQIEFHVQDRFEGSSKWSIKSLTKYAITNITSFSTLPLQIITFLGTIFGIFAIILSVQTLYSYWVGKSLEGFTTIIILLLLIGSILMISLGIIGYYIAKIYTEVKKRPRYIISQTQNCSNKK